MPPRRSVFPLRLRHPSGAVAKSPVSAWDNRRCSLPALYQRSLPSRAAHTGIKLALCFSWMLQFHHHGWVGNHGIVQIYATAIGLTLMLAITTRAFASEYGISSYRPGLMDLFAGYLAPPGSTIVKDYFLFQDASADAITANGHIEANSHTVAYTEAVFGAHITKYKILGSYWAFGAIAQTRLADQSLRVGPPGHLQHATDTIVGFGDLIVSPLMLSWSFGRFHLMNSLMFYAPTGDYGRHRIINIGLNRWAVEPDVGMTWMDEETGRQASAFFGYTINTTNEAAHYRSGDEFHADFVLAQHLLNGVVLGLA